jgi:hypothetical protein
LQQIGAEWSLHDSHTHDHLDQSRTITSSPCALPIIDSKARSFCRHAHHAATVGRLTWAYLLRDVDRLVAFSLIHISTGSPTRHSVIQTAVQLAFSGFAYAVLELRE